MGLVGFEKTRECLIGVGYSTTSCRAVGDCKTSRPMMCHCDKRLRWWNLVCHLDIT